MSNYLFYKMKYIQLILILSVIFSSCDSNNVQKENVVAEKCPCDSVGVFNENNGKEIECYLGKSLIGIKSKPNNDTIELTRYYTEDATWHVQEYLTIANDKIVHPTFAMYCEIKDSANFYKLSYIRDEDKFKSQGVFTNQVIGLDIIVNNDTISSKTIHGLIPKDKFKGIIKVEKILDITYKDERRITRASMFLDAETIIKYGNLLHQYRAIKKQCADLQ